MIKRKQTKLVIKQKNPRLGGPLIEILVFSVVVGKDSNLRPSGYEPEESTVKSRFTEWCNHSVTKNKIKASFTGLLLFNINNSY